MPAGRKVVISYSHEDEKRRKLVCKHLQVLEREHLIQLWDDEKLQGGDDWESQLHQALAEAHIAVLLISASFLTSDFILKREVRTFFDRYENEGIVIYPLLIQPCAYQTSGGSHGGKCARGVPLPSSRRCPPFAARRERKQLQQLPVRSRGSPDNGASRFMPVLIASGPWSR